MDFPAFIFTNMKIIIPIASNEYKMYVNLMYIEIEGKIWKVVAKEYEYEDFILHLTNK